MTIEDITGNQNTAFILGAANVMAFLRPKEGIVDTPEYSVKSVKTTEAVALTTQCVAFPGVFMVMSVRIPLQILQRTPLPVLHLKFLRFRL